MSVDDAHVYVVAFFSNSLAVFERQPNGTLVYKAVYKDGGADGDGNTIDGLQGAYGGR